MYPEYPSKRDSDILSFRYLPPVAWVSEAAVSENENGGKPRRLAHLQQGEPGQLNTAYCPDSFAAMESNATDSSPPMGMGSQATLIWNRVWSKKAECKGIPKKQGLLAEEAQCRS